MAFNKYASYTSAFNGLKSDVSLLRAFARGDAYAFESLYHRYKDQLFNHLCNQLGTHAEKLAAAEEIAQEVWMAIISGADNFEERQVEGRSSFCAWLFSIAHRRLADFWRQQYKHQSEQETRDSRQFETEQVTDLINSAPCLETSRLLQELERGLCTLPEEQRQTFLLRQEGFSYKEIADIAETGVETVKSRLRYSKQSLQKLLEDSHD